MPSSRLEEAGAEAERLGERPLAAMAALYRARIEGWLNRPDRVASILESWVSEFERLALRVDEVEVRVRYAMAILRLGREAEGLEGLSAAERRCGALGQRSGRAWVRYHRALADRARGRIAECRAALARCIPQFAKAGLHDLEAEARLVRAATEVDPGSAAVARQLRVTRREATRPENPWLAERWWRLYALHLAARGGSRRLFQAFDEAHGRLGRLRRSLPEDALRAFLLADKDDLYDTAVALPARRPRLFTGNAAARWVWRWTERAHAPRLRDPGPAHGSHGTHPAHAGPSGLEDAVERWEAGVARERARLWLLDGRELTERMGAERGRPRTPPSAERRRALARLEQFHRRLELARSRRSGGAPPREASVERLQRALGSREVLLEYHVGRRDLWVVRATRDQLDVVPLPGEPIQTRALVHRLRRLWDRWRLTLSHEDAPEALRRAEVHLLDALHRALLAPALENATFDDVAIVPHRWLHSLPFHALVGPGGCLADQANVRYGFSAAHALIPPAGATASGPPLVVGVSSEEAPRAADEARAVAALWLGACVLTGSAASAAAVHRRWPGSRIVHLAAHGHRHPDDPWSSGLLLHEGQFGVYDCDAIHSHVELVVLSACRTGDAVIWGSDDAFGLLPAVIRSGARAVVASLWTVGDASTHRWMTALHAHLARGARAERAVRAACHAVRQVHSSAFEWAPFALYGARGTGE